MKKMKKMKKILCSLLACLLVILAVPVSAEAAAKAPVCPKTQVLQYYRACMNNTQQRTGGYGYIFIKNLAKNATITNVKSSNKNYTATRVKGLNAIDVMQTQKSFRNFKYDVKDGESTKLSFTVKQNGKSYRLSCKVIFKAHEPVFKTFKLGSKDLTSLTSGYWMLRYNKIPQKGKVKVQIQTTKNYKIDSITVTYRNGDKYTSKKIKNGAKVSLKNAMSLNVDYHTTVKPKYYRKPSSDYVGYFFGGYVESPLYESFSLVMM